MISIYTLPNAMYAEIARFLGDSFPGDGFRRAAQTVQIKDHTNNMTYLNGLLHSFNDKPAIVYDNGDQVWCQHGKLHRDGDQPAVVCADGTHEWYQHGELHRDNDLPAMMLANGTHAWCQHDKLHRENRPAIIYHNGITEYWLNGKHTWLIN